MPNLEKYLRVVTWARKRYTIRSVLIVQIGNNLSAYGKIERAAWNKYS